MKLSFDRGAGARRHRFSSDHRATGDSASYTTLGYDGIGHIVVVDVTTAQARAVGARMQRVSDDEWIESDDNAY